MQVNNSKQHPENKTALMTCPSCLGKGFHKSHNDPDIRPCLTCNKTGRVKFQGNAEARSKFLLGQIAEHPNLLTTEVTRELAELGIVLEDSEVCDEI